MTTTTAEIQDSNFLEKAVRKIARSPSDSRKLARRRVSEARAKNPRASDAEVKSKAAKTIVRGHTARSAVAGGATGTLGAIPGVGTAVALTAGAATDIALYMKANVDMCCALVFVFHPNMPDDEAFSLAMMLAAYGSLEKRGVGVLGKHGTKLASDAGVRILRQQLRGGTLIAVKQVFKRVGIVFTRKAVEKAIPFGVGAVIGAGANAGMTTYVGRNARKWLELDAKLS